MNKLINYKQKGGVNTYITQNPNDPRIQQYQDSLEAHNYGLKTFRDRIQMEQNSKNKGWNINHYSTTNPKTLNQFKYQPKSGGQPLAPTMNIDSYDMKDKGSKLSNLLGYNNINTSNSASSFNFKKPTQLVQYQKPVSTIKRTLTTYKTPEAVTPVTQPVAKPIQYREEPYIMKVRVPNPERTDTNRVYNQAENSHEEERRFIRRVPVSQ